MGIPALILLCLSCASAYLVGTPAPRCASPALIELPSLPSLPELPKPSLPAFIEEDVMFLGLKKSVKDFVTFERKGVKECEFDSNGRMVYNPNTGWRLKK